MYRRARNRLSSMACRNKRKETETGTENKKQKKQRKIERSDILDATFVITNGEKYIRCDLQGKYKQVNNITIADTFSTKKSAMNIYLNSLCKAWQRDFYVAEYRDGEIVKCSVSRPQKAAKNSIAEKYEVKNPILGTEQWEERLQGMENFFKDAEKRNNELAEESRDIEAKIVDMEHYVEFNKLNAVNGFKTYSKLHTLLEKRRAIKNEQKLVSVICKNFNCSVGIDAIIQTMEGIKKQKYVPRIYPELFKNGIEVLE